MSELITSSELVFSWTYDCLICPRFLRSLLVLFTFVLFLFGLFHLVFNVLVKSKLQHPPPPRVISRAFEFLKKFCLIPPPPLPPPSLLTGPSCSNAPTTGKITRILFQLYTVLTVQVNMVCWTIHISKL